MGAFAGAAQIIGDRMHGEHLLDVHNQYLTNNAMAEMYMKKANDPDTLPEYAPRYMQAALAWRLLPPGKKAPKNAEDLNQLQIQEARQRLMQRGGQGQGPQNAPGIPQGAPPANPMAAPPPSAQGLPPGMPADYRGTPNLVPGGPTDGQGGPTPLSPTQGAASSAPQGPLAPLPQSTGGDDPQEMMNQAIQAQQVQAAAPPPVSGLPSPGFGVGPQGGAAIPAPPMAPPPGMGAFGPPPGVLPTQLERYNQMAIAAELMKAEAQQQARMREMIGVSGFNKQQEREEIAYRIKQLKDAGVWNSLSPRQKSELQIGAKQITPERTPVRFPNIPTASLPPDAIDAQGQPIDRNHPGTWTAVISQDGISPTFYVPNEAKTTLKSVQDEASQTGQSYQPFNRMGAPVGTRTPGAPPVGSDLEKYIQSYAKSKGLPVNEKTRLEATRAFAQARQLPPQTLMIAPPPSGEGPSTAIAVRPGAKIPMGAQTAAGVNAVNTPTAQMRNVGAQAQLVHEQTPQVLAELDRLKAKIGPMAGRWNEVMQGKIGLEDPDFAGLRANLLMYSSAVALMHARGRLPENLRKEFDTAINNPGQNFSNLKAVIRTVDGWTASNMETMRGKGGAGITPPPSAGEELPAEAASVLKEGVNTTFKNGQTWTKKNGKNVRVK